ncbi:hypothetical protein D3C87_1839080 [compost metagenome]
MVSPIANFSSLKSFAAFRSKILTRNGRLTKKLPSTAIKMQITTVSDEINGFKVNGVKLESSSCKTGRIPWVRSSDGMLARSPNIEACKI